MNEKGDKLMQTRLVESADPAGIKILSALLVGRNVTYVVPVDPRRSDPGMYLR